jgi:hypothetical protein
MAMNDSTRIILRWLTDDPDAATRLRSLARTNNGIGALRGEAEDYLSGASNERITAELMDVASRDGATYGSRENTVRVLMDSVDWDAVGTALDADRGS